MTEITQHVLAAVIGSTYMLVILSYIELRKIRKALEQNK